VPGEFAFPEAAPSHVANRAFDLGTGLRTLVEVNTTETVLVLLRGVFVLRRALGDFVGHLLTRTDSGEEGGEGIERDCRRLRGRLRCGDGDGGDGLGLDDGSCRNSRCILRTPRGGCGG